MDSQGKDERVGETWHVNCVSEDIQDVVREITNVQQMNKRAKSSKTYHLMISFHKNDPINPEMMKAIESEICEALGYGEHQRVSVVHYDTNNPHIHVAINKIHPRRFTSHTPIRDFRTLLKISEELQIKYGLTPDNHLVKKPGAYNKALDMENKAGLQSFIGWMQENCLQQLKSADNWQLFINILRTHNIELRQRGNGYIFVSKDGTAVKASSVDRALSKNQLSKRLGTIEKSMLGNQLKHHKTKKTYTKKPTKRFNKPLYKYYCVEQEKIITQRDALLTMAKDNRHKEIDQIVRSAKLKRAMIKNMPGGFGKKMMYWATYQAQKRDIKRVKDQYLRERKQIYKRYSRTPWREWRLKNINNLDKHIQISI